MDGLEAVDGGWGHGPEQNMRLNFEVVQDSTEYIRPNRSSKSHSNVRQNVDRALLQKLSSSRSRSRPEVFTRLSRVLPKGTNVERATRFHHAKRGPQDAHNAGGCLKLNVSIVHILSPFTIFLDQLLVPFRSPFSLLWSPCISILFHIF